MRNPENVLISLTKHSNQKDYKYERLYRLLYNEELYVIRLLLLQRKVLISNKAVMFPGVET